MKHTPTPWRIWRDMDPKEPVQIIGMETDFICEIAGENTQAPANAAFIVRAVNAHEKLVEALKACQRELLLIQTGTPVDGQIIGLATAAINLSGEGDAK